MTKNILASYVRDKLLISIWFFVQDYTDLVKVLFTPEVFASEENAEFKRHVKTRKGIYRIEIGSRYVMNAVPAFRDDFHDSFKSVLTRVTDFQGTSGYKSSIMDSEDNGIKYRFVHVIKGTIYKNIVFIICRHSCP